MSNVRSFLSKAFESIDKRCQVIQIDLNKLNEQYDESLIEAVSANFTSIKEIFSLVESGALAELTAEACKVIKDVISGKLTLNPSMLDALMCTSIVLPASVKKIIEGTLIGNEDIYGDYIASLRVCRGLKNKEGTNLSLIKLPEALPQAMLHDDFSGSLDPVEAGDKFASTLLAWLSSENNVNTHDLLLKLSSAVAVTSNEPRMAMLSAIAAYALMATEPGHKNKEVANYLSKVSTVYSKTRDLPVDTAAQVMADSSMKSILAYIASAKSGNPKVHGLLKTLGIGKEKNGFIVDTAPSERELIAELMDQVLLAKTHFNKADTTEKATHFTEQISAFNKRMIQIHSLLLFAKKENIKALGEIASEVSSYSQGIVEKDDVTRIIQSKIVDGLFNVERGLENECDNKLIREILGEGAGLNAVSSVIENVISELYIATKDVSDFLRGSAKKDKALAGVNRLLEASNSISFINLKEIVPLLCTSSSLIKSKLTTSDCNLDEDEQFKVAAYGVVAAQQYLSSLIEGFYPRADLVKKGMRMLSESGIEIVGQVKLDHSEEEAGEDCAVSVFISEAVEHEGEIKSLKIGYKIEEKEIIYKALALITKLRDAAEAANLTVISEYANYVLRLVEYHNESGLDDDINVDASQKALRIGVGRIQSLIDEVAEHRQVKTWTKGWISEIVDLYPSDETKIELDEGNEPEAENESVSADRADENPTVVLDKSEEAELSDFIDDEFLDIYRGEVERFVIQLREEIHAKPVKLTKPMLRAVHSLKGAAGSVDFNEAHMEYGKLERILEEVFASGETLTEKVLGHLEAVSGQALEAANSYPANREFTLCEPIIEALTEILSEASHPQESRHEDDFEVIDDSESVHHVEADIEVEDEPEYEDDGMHIYDPDLLELYVEDAEPLLSSLRDDYTIWTSNLNDKSVTASIHRAMHSLKGLGNLVGATPMGELCHEFETLFDLIKGGAITDRKAAADLVNISIGVLEEQSALICKGLPIKHDERLYNCIRECVGNNRIDLSLLSDNPEAPENTKSKGEDTPVTKAGPEPATPDKVRNEVVVEVDRTKNFGEEDQPKKILPASDKVQQKKQPRESLHKEIVETNIQRELNKMIRARTKKVKKKGQAEKLAKLKIEPDLIDNTIDISNELSGGMHKLEVSSMACRKQVGDIADKLHAVDRYVDALMLEVRNVLNTGLKANDKESHDSLEKFDDISDIIVKMSSYTHYLKDDAESVLQELDVLRRGIKGQRSLVRDSREGLHGTRLVSFDKYKAKYEAALSVASSRLQKEVELQIKGGTTLIDRYILETLNEPIGHVLRNAVAHGIESSEERKKAGKPSSGQISVEVRKESTNIIIVIQDDGKGINPTVIHEKALEKGLIGSDDELNEMEMLNLISIPGFTTAETLSDVSGRGVGMDVVRNEVERVGGILKIESVIGEYTRFTLVAPEAVGASQCMLINAGSEQYALSSNQLEHIEFAKQDDIRETREKGAFRFVDTEYRYIHISELIGIPENKNLSMKGMVPLVLISFDGHHLAIEVDDAKSMVELNIKQLPPAVRHIKSISGYSELADGQPIYILDLYNLFRTNIEVVKDRLVTRPSKVRSVDRNKKSRALVVDDSSAYRKSTQRYLERLGYDVKTATGALDGLEVISTGWIPDVILLDAEMPGMDGFGFAQSIRARTQTKDIPIIMITSRAREKFESKAKSVGIDVFMNKPFEEENLRSSIDQLLLMEVEA